MRWDQSQPSSTLQRGHTHRYETPPVAGPRRRRRVVLGKLGRVGINSSGTQRPRTPAIRPRRRVLCLRPANPPPPASWLFRFCPVVAEAGRRPLSAVSFSSSPSAGRSVRSGSPWAAGPNIHVYSNPKFSSCRMKRRGTIHPLSLRIPKGLLQPAPPPDGGHRACCCIVPLPERPTGLVRQPIRNERRPVERQVSSC